MTPLVCFGENTRKYRYARKTCLMVQKAKMPVGPAMELTIGRDDPLKEIRRMGPSSEVEHDRLPAHTLRAMKCSPVVMMLAGRHRETSNKPKTP